MSKILLFVLLKSDQMPHASTLLAKTYQVSIQVIMVAGQVANSANPDQMAHFVAFDQGLHCLLRSVCRESTVALLNGTVLI